MKVWSKEWNRRNCLATAMTLHLRNKGISSDTSHMKSPQTTQRKTSPAQTLRLNASGDLDLPQITHQLRLITLK